MVFTRKYNLVNNVAGWGVFVIALLTYWLTLEPTASYWDCGEFIIQADKLEIGHPPGNPIFMLTARFFANFAFGDSSLVALMVNAMSGLLSALTILLLFWTITHLTRRLTVKDKAAELSLTQYLIVIGSGVCGALAYTWSDTFWFSAVEGEVYAFSSFCTALVFWLILKWENRADLPHSDRYLILIAYIIGVSIAVHLLNLLCIPAIVLVYCYRKVPDMNVKKSLLALLVGFGIIVFVLYGLVPGFIEVAGWFELFAVNTLHLPFNSGLILYTVLTIGALAWAIYEITTQRSAARIRISFMLAVVISGILFIGSGLWLGFLLLIALGVLLYFVWKSRLPMRWMGLVLWSIAVIFAGYSSYALILIRSNAHTPMNQNTPDNVFSLSSYLNREQYGETPLLYGHTFESQPQMIAENYENPDYAGVMEQNKIPVTKKGKALYAKGVKGAKPDNANEYLTPGQEQDVAALDRRGGDFYALYDYQADPVMNPQLNILLPRMHSSMPSHQAAYAQWVPDLLENSEVVQVMGITDPSGSEEIPLLDYDYAMDPETGSYATNEDGVFYHNNMTAHKPTFGQNLSFFFNYQLNHMYWRYFLWNFAGRQNDINNQNGEKDAGNWLSGIPFIDNARLGDQSLLPDEYGKGNAAHNVFYMLPLLLGIIGLLWQAFCGKRGIEQFWVVFFLFFMTGIAIVLYLNQTPLQPRERDYAYAGSFYAFAIWIGMGVAALHRAITYGMERLGKKGAGAPAAATPQADTAQEAHGTSPVTPRQSLIAAGVAALIGLLVPLQMVSQTWDDHDRSGRYAARDYAINYLNSLEPNAIVFCNGDNDTFPLWYAQEVEGVRPDVKIINLSYLASEWYANQQRLQTYSAAPVSFTATPQDYAYGRRDVVRATEMTDFGESVPLLTALKEIYSDKALEVDPQVVGPVIAHGITHIDVDTATVRKRGLVPEGVEPDIQIPVQLNSMALDQILMLDIIATNAAEGWKRPIYWACTVGTEYYQQFLPYVRFTGMAYQLVPYMADGEVDTEIGYNIIMGKNGKPGYLWGGADNYSNPPYFDETASRMLAATRLSMLDLAKQLVLEGTDIQSAAGGMTPAARRKFDMAAEVLKRFEAKLAGSVRPLAFSDVYTYGTTWCTLGEALKNKEYMKRGLKALENAIIRYAQNVKYTNMLASKWGVRKNTLYLSEDSAVDVITGLNAQTTPENALILFSYYELVKLYNSFADIMAHDFDQAACSNAVLNGDELTDATLTLLKKAGINAKLAERLKKYYTDYTMYSDYAAGGYGSYGGNDYGDFAPDTLDEATLRQYADELARWAEIVVTMQGKSEADYAASSSEELTIDSIFYLGLQQFIELGGSTEMLGEYAIFDQVDAERTLRLSTEFDKNHPEEGL